jgi:hypothetical protein
MRRAKDFVSWSEKTSALHLLLFKFHLAKLKILTHKSIILPAVRKKLE